MSGNREWLPLQNAPGTAGMVHIADVPSSVDPRRDAADMGGVELLRFGDFPDGRDKA